MQTIHVVLKIYQGAGPQCTRICRKTETCTTDVLGGSCLKLLLNRLIIVLQHLVVKKEAERGFNKCLIWFVLSLLC